MKINDNITFTPVAPLPAAGTTPARHSRKQLSASILTRDRDIKALWKRLVPEARSVWAKIPVEDLERVRGDFNVLAGQVQLRYRVSREESDRQVREFFDKHHLHI